MKKQRAKTREQKEQILKENGYVQVIALVTLNAIRNKWSLRTRNTQWYVTYVHKEDIKNIREDKYGRKFLRVSEDGYRKNYTLDAIFDKFEKENNL